MGVWPAVGSVPRKSTGLMVNLIVLRAHCCLLPAGVTSWNRVETSAAFLTTPSAHAPTADVDEADSSSTSIPPVFHDPLCGQKPGGRSARNPRIDRHKSGLRASVWDHKAAGAPGRLWGLSVWRVTATTTGVAAADCYRMPRTMRNYLSRCWITIPI